MQNHDLGVLVAQGNRVFPREGGLGMKKVLAFAAAAALASFSTVADAANDGKNRVVVVENISNQTLNYLYASPITSKTWEEDLLGTDRVLSRGESIEANIDNGTNECQYDLKAVMADGKEVIRRNINVCAISKWTIGDSGDSIG